MSKKLLPRFKRVFTKLFIEPSQGLIRRLGEDVPPQTALRRMEGAAKRAAERIAEKDLEGFARDLFEMIKAAPEPEREMDVPAPATEAENRVFSVLDSLDQALPHGTIALLTMMVGIHRATDLAIRYETVRLAQRVEDSRDEERALRLKEFAWHVVEQEHVRFLHVLLQASWIADGKQYRSINSIGDLVNQVGQKNLLGSLLWPEIRHVRNAASHGGGWSYDLDRAMIVLQDRRKDGTTWTQSFEVDALFGKIFALVAMTDTLAAALHRAFVRDLMRPMLGPFLHAVRTGTEDPASKAIFEVFVERLLLARDRMFELGWKLAG